MASALNTKINSYALERGIEFDQAFTLTPTRTGTNGNGIFTQNSLGGTVYEPTVGPAGGSGSWKFVLSNVTNTTSYIRNATNTNVTECLGMSDGDFSVGVWFKIPALPAGTNNGAMAIFVASAPTTTGYSCGISGSTSTYPSKLTFNPGTGGSSFYSSITPTVNVWHYVAIVKTGNTASYFYDGQLVGTGTGLSTGGSVTAITHGSTAYGGTNPMTMNYSNYYLTTSSAIGATQIAEIWAVGRTPPYTRTVKYYDGSSWQTSSAQKVWNGTAWIDWNAKKYDGTSWVTI